MSVESTIKEKIRNKNVDPINLLEKIKIEVERQLMAEKLLRHVLGDNEYKNFLDNGEIKVKSKIYHDRVYAIKEYGLIDVIENDNIIERLCIHPAESDFPSQDQMVTKKLGLETIEDLILKTANHIPALHSDICEIIREFKVEHMFTSNKELLENIDASKKFNFEDNIFSDRGEYLEKLKSSRQFNLEYLFH